MYMQHNYSNRRDKQGQDSICKTSINCPLSDFYNDGAKLYLPGNGYAYKYAYDLAGKTGTKKVNSNQLRKILDEIKACTLLMQEVGFDDEQFEKIKNRLFVLVPMTAYNAKRIRAHKLYEFIRNHINEVTIQTQEDVKVLDSLFTSIVAYHKSLTDD